MLRRLIPVIGSASSGPERDRQPWVSVAFLKVARGGGLALSDASRANSITVSRRFERFRTLETVRKQP